MRLYDFFLPLAGACFGIFCLCLISFIGGALYQGLTEQWKAKYLNLTAACVIAALVLCILPHIL